ncbi:kinase [Pseudoxanthomonas sangjuensis]|uniref:kinase n=1 Tax=Pseudoxanthomonas sangjuensis TaxID=1503750 RepID=UPI001390D778|nr:kinase [Pseudoxanthomonas sangjuensis]KAF1713142.1 kinase [Pseudoxanthomonas sangjuensis]
MNELQSPGFPDALVAEALDAALSIRNGPVPAFGISGLQGTGKSTLAAQVAALARSRGLRAAVVSIDDFYLRKAERETLARDVHPLLATRGPPGTHDMALALRTLDALRAGEPATLPRFDKLGDDRLPESRWERIDGPADVVVFEGWFLATPAEDEAALAVPVNALERGEDAGGTWRRWCNAALARDYPALWSRIDALWFLQPPGFEVVPQWRWEQEQALQAGDPSRKAMDRAQVERFVQHYERTSRQALRTLPAIADRVVPLDARRRPFA